MFGTLVAAIFHRKPATIRKAAYVQRRKLLLEVLEDRLAPANVVWDGGGADNLASNAVNWAGDTLPVANDTLVYNNTSTKAATIDPAFLGVVAGMTIDAAYNSTITLARSLAVAENYSQTGTTVTGAGDLTLQGGSTISSVGAPNNPTTLSGTGTTTVASGGLLVLGGGGDINLDQRALVIADSASASLLAGRLVVANGASILVDIDGEFQFLGNNLIAAGVGAPGSFTNFGTVLKSQGNITQIAIPFTNYGTVQANSGILSFSANFDQIQTVVGAAVLDIAANAEVQGNSITMTSGTLQGAGILRVTADGTLDWYSAVMSGTGQVVVDPGATMLIENGLTDGGFTINNLGTIGWLAGNITLNNGAVINNKSGALFEVESNADMNNVAGEGTFNNYGTLRKIQSGVAGITNINVTFNSVTGGPGMSLVETQFGSLRFNRSGTLQGNFLAGQNTRIEFRRPGSFFYLLNNTTFNGNGQFVLDFGATMWLADGANVVNTAAFQFGGPSGFDPTIRGNGQFVNNGTFRWLTGNLIDLAMFLNQADMTIVSTSIVTPVTIDSSILRNQGTITWTGFDILVTSATNPNRKSEIINFGTFDIRTDATLINDAATPGFQFWNQGTFKKTAGDGVTTIELPFKTVGIVDLGGRWVMFTDFTQEYGTVRVSNGRLAANSYTFVAGVLDLGNNGRGTVAVAGAGLTIPQGATLTGIGAIHGTVTNQGIINSALTGAPVGEVIIIGNYTQTATGSLRLRLQQVGNTFSNDKLTIAGTATLAGNLQVTAVGILNPPVGTQFTILTYDNHVGDFNRPYMLPPLIQAPNAPGDEELTLFR